MKTLCKLFMLLSVAIMLAWQPVSADGSGYYQFEQDSFLSGFERTFNDNGIMYVASENKAEGGGGSKDSNPWQAVPDDACSLWSPEGLSSEVCVDDPDGVSGRDYLCTLPATCLDGLET